MEEIYEARAGHYKKADKLPIEEKIKRLMNMQRAFNSFNKKGEKGRKVWEI